MIVRLLSFCFFVILILNLCEGMRIKREVKRIDLKPSQIGISSYLTVHQYKVATSSDNNISSIDKNKGMQRQAQTAYIQASLHADEIPGLLVNHHLIKLLDQAAEKGHILNNIHVCAYANPIGMSQIVLGSHIGRFNLDTGNNFNRDFPDISSNVIKNLQSKLIHGNTPYNIKLIRQVILDVLDKEYNVVKLEKVLKKELFKMAVVADVVLDLHSDTAAILHMYTHDKLWPHMKDLASCLGVKCVLLAPSSDDACCDESCYDLWNNVVKAFPEYNIPIACEPATVELRGETDVTDGIAVQDATAIYNFLTHRGYIAVASTVTVSGASSGSDITNNMSGVTEGTTDNNNSNNNKSNSNNNNPSSLISSIIGDNSSISSTSNSISTLAPLLPPLQCNESASPLAGVDMIESAVYGVIVWKCALGDYVLENDVVAEVVNIEDVDGVRTELRTKTSGIVFARSLRQLVTAGQIVVKVSGDVPLPWRVGKLLTA